MAVAQATLDGVLNLIDVLADQDRAKKYLADLKDAGTNAARLEAEKYAEGLSRPVARREAAAKVQDQVLQKREAAGAEIGERVRALEVREAAAAAREEALQGLASKLDRQAADLNVQQKDLERRLIIIKKAAIGPV